MPLVTGNVSAITNKPMTGLQPVVVFTLNKANGAGGALFSTEAATVTPDSKGNFSINLAGTQDMRDNAWYTVAVRWIGGAGATESDFPDWRIVVPREGGPLTNLIAGPPENTRQVYVSETEPDAPRPMQLWLEQDPNDPTAGSAARLKEFRRGGWGRTDGMWKVIADLKGAPGMNALGTEPQQEALAGWLEGQVNPFQSAVQLLVDAQIQARGIIFSVKDFGAVGNGVTDDMAAVQATVDAADAAGGGAVHFPPGRYYISNRVWLRPNLTITGDGATLAKRAGAPSSVFFAGSTGNKAGYGAGPGNITLRGLRFEGVFGAGGIGGCIMALHHCDDILVEGCTFSQVSRPNGHRFDLQGCRRVVIRQNVFEGFDTSTPEDQWYAEDIQLDLSTRIGGSIEEPNASNPAIYDGLPCLDILVTGNRWTSLATGSGQFYPATSTVLGSHSAVVGMYHKRITFTDNTVGGSVTNESSFANGRVRFWAAAEVIVRGNAFDGGGNERQAAIRLHRVTSARALADVGTTGGSNVALSTHMACWNVKIDGNSFHNFAPAVASAIGVIQLEAWAGNTPHTDVWVTNNVFRDNKYAGDVTVNDGMTLVVATNVRGLQVTGNQATMSRRFLIATACEDGRASDNRVEGTNNNSLQAVDCTRFTLAGNQVTGLTGSPCLLINGGNLNAVTGNRVLSGSASIVAIRVTGGASRTTVEGNLAGGQGTTINRAVELSGSSVATIVRNTTTTYVSTGVYVESGSTAAVNEGTTNI